MSSNPNQPPVMDPSEPLAQYWDKPVSELVALPDAPISPEDQERHTIYSLLLMSLIASFWNGNKHGQDGVYPWRPKQLRPDGIYNGGQYLGHNIACLAVDGEGEVIDFDFNHNNIFSSSVEHAESRLVRRVFSLAQIYDNWEVKKAKDLPASSSYMSILSNVTIYTSLESCAQCSGIMALGAVKAVVYMQHDPGQFLIGNILRNLTTASLRAPLPISADKIGFPYYDQLNNGYKNFYDNVGTTPFYTKGTQKPDTAQSITSFLCTDEALSIFQAAAAQLSQMQLKYPDYTPLDSTTNQPRGLNNQSALEHSQQFFIYASHLGLRGTPHKQ